MTLRADFYDRPLIYPRFGELLAERTEAVPPLTPDELEQAIRGPAERVGIRPEPGLVAEMIADVAHQPGALPLLQYALTELFERRDDDRLTLAAYREIGGIAGALSARAERIYEATDPQGRRATKQVFLRLGHPRRGAPGHAPPRRAERTRRPRGGPGGDRRRRGHLRAPPAPHLRSGALHPGAHGRDRPRGTAQRLGTAANLDRRRARGPPTGARPGASGRGVARLRRRPELPHARCPAGPARGLGRDHGPGDRATRACVPEGERRSARPRAGGGGAAARARGQIERRSLAGCVAWSPSSRPRLSSPDRSRSSPRTSERARGRSAEAADRDREGARRGRGGEPGGRPRAQRPARDRGCRDDPLVGRDRSSGGGGGAPPRRRGVPTRARGARGGRAPRLEPHEGSS